eukprot:3398502-Rhodomonas_salina.1
MHKRSGNSFEFTSACELQTRDKEKVRGRKEEIQGGKSGERIRRENQRKKQRKNWRKTWERGKRRKVGGMAKRRKKSVGKVRRERWAETPSSLCERWR